MKFIEFGINIARRSGEMIANDFNADLETSWKEDLSPVTNTDKKVNEYVVESIRRQFPQHTILSEEGGYVGDGEYTWIVDPLDGTIPFMHGWPTFVFSLALVKDHEVVLGILNDPLLKRLVSAEKGQGAFLNGHPIKVSKDTELTFKSIINGAFQEEIYRAREILVERGCKVINLYSPQYASMLVALGKISAEVFALSTPWDAGAAKIIVEEAGGRVTDLNGMGQDYTQKINGFVATNGIIHNELVEILKSK